MIAGYEYTGKKTIYKCVFNRFDKQRRKMSKSLGNSPDPLDLIEKFVLMEFVGLLLSASAGHHV
jgi:valyl-tRNA synthetase